MSTNTDAQLAAQAPARRVPAFDQVLPAYQADPAIRKHAQDNRRIWRETNGALEVAQKHVIEFTLIESYWDHKPLPSAQFLRWHNKHVFLTHHRETSAGSSASLSPGLGLPEARQ